MTGPVPDFARARFVATHAELVNVQPEVVFALEDHLRDRHIVEHSMPERAPALGLEGPDESLIWMRDYQPIFARRSDGSLVAYRYLAWNPNRASYRPWHLSEPPEQNSWWDFGHSDPGIVPIEVLPLVHEQGNLVTTGTHIFVSKQLIDDNRIEWDEPHLRAAGYRPRGPDEIIALLANALGRASSDVVVLDRLPGEATGHVDLFMMPIAEDIVVVPEVTNEGIDAVVDPGERGFAIAAQDFLDDVASRLEAEGVSAPRLPMLPPRIVAVDDATDDEGPWGLTYLSPANGLLIRGGDSAEVYLPVVAAHRLPADHAELQRRYVGYWRRFFAAHGWTPHFVNVDRLSTLLGLLRCVTAVTPY